MAKVGLNQLYEGSSWSGYTDKNHLINAYGMDPVHIAERVEMLLDVNDGVNIVSKIMNKGLYTIPAHKDEYQWRVQNTSVENYMLLGAYEDRHMSRIIGDQATQTPGFRAGANRNEFFLLFKEKPFSNTQIIVGMKPDLYDLWVIESIPVGGDRTLYKVQLSSSTGPEDYLPSTELYEGSRWSANGGLVPEERSYEGFDINFRTHGAFANRLSPFRMQHEVPGNMFKQKVKPLVFHVKNKKGKSEQLWLSNIEYEFLRQMRWATAATVMDAKSNVWTDGTIANIDKNGHTAARGAGFKQLYSSTNMHTWNDLPNPDEMLEFILDAVINKTQQRDAEVISGEYGFKVISEQLAKKYGAGVFKDYPWMGDTSGRAYDWNGNYLSVKTGQIKKVAEVNGVNLTFIIDSSKDDRRRNKIMHPLGGPASSYEFDIIGLGGKDEKSNLQIVRREGEAPMWRTIEGMRGFLNEGSGSFYSPQRISTSVDASTLHYFEPGIGAIVWDPTSIVRYYPEETQI